MPPVSYHLVCLRYISDPTSACSSLHTPARVCHAVSDEKKPIPSLTSRFMCAMILFDEVVEVFTLPQFTRVWQNPFRFQFLESFWIGWVFINRDDSRSAGMGRSKRFREEALG
jgi:hypothetical protein